MIALLFMATLFLIPLLLLFLAIQMAIELTGKPFTVIGLTILAAFLAYFLVEYIERDNIEIYHMNNLIENVTLFEKRLNKEEGIMVDTNNTYMNFDENGQLKLKGSDGEFYYIFTKTKNSQIKISSRKTQYIDCSSIYIKNDSLDEGRRVLHYDSCVSYVPEFIE